MYSAGGLRRCYRAFNVMVIRDVPASIVYFVVYDMIWHHLMQRINRMSNSRRRFGAVVSSLVAGGAAGVLSWSIVFPIDLVKSRMQADYECRRYTSWRQCVADISQERGQGRTKGQIARLLRLKAFYAGLTPCLLRAFPVNAVTFAVHYEMLKLLQGDIPSMLI
jgi:solute carrier family 25 (mitochondrial carnitine/acylcarnitine transporter), member 20/29